MKRVFWHIVCLLLACASLAPQPAWASDANTAMGQSSDAPQQQRSMGPSLEPLSWGPLGLRSRAPIFDNRLSYTPGRVAVLGRRRFEVQANWSHVNVWAQMPSYFLDGEWSRLDLRAALGLGHRTEVRFDMGGMYRSGGYLDGFIEGFHSALGITQSRRLNYPKDRLHVATSAPDNAQAWLDDSDAGFGLTNPVIAIKYGVVSSVSVASIAPSPSCEATHFGLNGPNISFDFAVKLPLGSTQQQFASRRVTLLANVALQQPVTAWLHVFATYGLMLSPGIAPFYGMPMSEVQKFISLALVLRVAPACSLAIQYLNQDGGIESAAYAPMERTTHEFGLGAKWAPWRSDAYVLEAGIIENTVHDANTPDFGFTLGARMQR